jgi:PTH1 family peptidyl-tRNA hydrolase
VSKIRLIVGLGNPGAQYAATRHNAGAWFIDFLANQETVSLRSVKQFHGHLAEFQYQNNKCFLFIPSTYMNDSGRAVAALVKFYKILPQEMLVAHDELDFEAGVVRLKQGGGHGGHNGLRDIIAHLNTSDFYRLRLGIGHPGHRDAVANYVLANPGRDERAEIMHAIDDAARIIPELLSGEFQKALHQLHSD